MVFAVLGLIGSKRSGISTLCKFDQQELDDSLSANSRDINQFVRINCIIHVLLQFEETTFVQK